MPNSICPKGWRLPPASDNKSYENLLHDAYDMITNSSSVSDTEILASPLSFVRLGNYYSNSGSLDDRGGGGYYWASTAYIYMDSYGSYYLNFGPKRLYSQGGTDRFRGYSIRCVSR